MEKDHSHLNICLKFYQIYSIRRKNLTNVHSTRTILDKYFLLISIICMEKHKIFTNLQTLLNYQQRMVITWILRQSIFLTNEIFINDYLKTYIKSYLCFLSIYIESIKKYSRILEVNQVNTRLFENM